MRHGKVVAAAMLALATTAGAAGALGDPGARAEARLEPELAAPGFASAFERVWGFLIAIWDQTRGTIVPADGGGGEGFAALIPDGE